MGRLTAWFACAAFACTLLACSNEPPDLVRASEFDQSCERHEDCALVSEETCQQCAGCGGRDAAVNSAALEAFESAKDEANEGCDTLSTSYCNNACASNELPMCRQGQCVAVSVGMEAKLYEDRSCETAADCMMLSYGYPCPGCGCSEPAVNAASYLAKIAAANGLESLSCEPQPDPEGWRCSPASCDAVVACEDNTCVTSYPGLGR